MAKAAHTESIAHQSTFAGVCKQHAPAHHLTTFIIVASARARNTNDVDTIEVLCRYPQTHDADQEMEMESERILVEYTDAHLVVKWISVCLCVSTFATILYICVCIPYPYVHKYVARMCSVSANVFLRVLA